MANNFDKITYEEQNYYPRDTRGTLIVGTQNSVTNLWKGPLPEGIDRYPTAENGESLIIDYFLPFAGTDEAATLNLGNLGAKPVMTSHDGDTKGVTNEFDAKSVIRLAYVIDGTKEYWKVVGSDAKGGGGGGGTVTPIKNPIGSASNWSQGTLPTLTPEDVENIVTFGNGDSWSDGQMTEVSVTEGVMTITKGHMPSFTYTLKDVKSAKSFSQGTLPSLTVTSTYVVTDITQE